MDSLKKAWYLATLLYYGLKANGAEKTGASKEQLMNTRIFNRIGTDVRTKEKYWGIMLTENFMLKVGNGNFAPPENIEVLKPKSLFEALKEARSNNIQTTLLAEQTEKEQHEK